MPLTHSLTHSLVRPVIIGWGMLEPPSLNHSEFVLSTTKNARVTRALLSRGPAVVREAEAEMRFGCTTLVVCFRVYSVWFAHGAKSIKIS